MKPVRWALLTILLTAAACGSHSSAPVVYGTDPARQTRVYRSPDDIKRAQEAQRAAQASAYQKPVYQARSTPVEPAQLTPVSAIYLDEPARRTSARTQTSTPR